MTKVGGVKIINEEETILGFMDKLKKVGQGALKAMTRVGYVSSHDFPVGTTINFGDDEG